MKFLLIYSRDLESSAKIIEELKLTRQHGLKQKGGDPLEKSLIEVRAQLYKVISSLHLYHIMEKLVH